VGGVQNQVEASSRRLEPRW